jgi:hypothetical protein
MIVSTDRALRKGRVEPMTKPTGSEDTELSTAVDDLTELVERAAAAEKVVLALKWRELGRPSPDIP